MICKYCGAPYTGNRCTSCGKVIPLVKRSTNLEQLMSGTNNPNENDRPQAKTFEQGLKEGYQKGLNEGYNNGYAEGKEDAVQNKHPVKMRHAGIIIFTAIVILFTAISGLLFSKIGFNNGYKQGMDLGIAKGTEEGSQTATERMKDHLDEQYQAGYEQGQSEGYETGFEEGKNEGYQLGYDAAKNENVGGVMPEQQDQETTPEPQTVLELELPYSQARNGGLYNPIVEKIQRRLKELGYKNGKKDIATDGIYGPNTEKVVRMFQKKNSLPVSGIVDIDTYELLFPEELPLKEKETDDQDNNDLQEDDNDQLTPEKERVEDNDPSDPSLPEESPTPTNPPAYPTFYMPFSLWPTPEPKNKLPLIPKTIDEDNFEAQPQTSEQNIDSLLS